MIHEGMEELPRPVLVLLTHCHRDHARALLWMKDRLQVPCFYVAQQAGASALQQGDAEVSASFIYGEEGILAEMDGALLGDGRFPVSPKLDFCRFGPVVDDGRGDTLAKSQALHLADGGSITVFHTPGHSDDSLCVQIGGYLFCGDILFAHRPVVAGLPGWSAENVLRSLAFLDQVLAHGTVETVWSGHGKALTVEAAHGIILSVIKETAQMGALVRLDARRIQFLKECAVVFVREVGMQLIAQGGRLVRIAEGLSELEEEGLAKGLRHDVDMDAIDQYLEEFHRFEQGQVDDPMLAAIPLKGVELIRKIRKVLKAMPLPDEIGAMYLFRMEFLLNDYVALMLGVDSRRCVSATALLPVLRAVLQVLKPVPLNHDELANLAVDEKAFGLYLAKRLDEQARRGVVTVSASAEDERATALVASDRLSVLLGDMLEMAMSGDERVVTVGVCREEDRCGLQICTNPPLVLSARKTHFYDLLVSLSGGSFSSGTEGTIRVLFPDAGSIRADNSAA